MNGRKNTNRVNSSPYDKYWGTENEEYLEIDERTRALATNVAKGLNSVSVILGLSFLLYPKYYEAQFLILVLLPFLALGIVFFGKGLWNSISHEESIIPGFSNTLRFSFAVILLRAIMDYTILDYSKIWLATLILTPILTSAYLFATRREFNFNHQPKWENIVLVGCFSIVWGLFTFFTSIMVNCTFDSQSGEYVESSIADKRSNRSRKGGRHFYVDVHLPEPYLKTESVRLSQNRWNNLETGQEVDIEIKSGYIGADWLVLYQP